MLLKTHVSLAACPIGSVSKITKELLSAMEPEKKDRKKKRVQKGEDDEDDGGVLHCVDGYPMITNCRFSPFYKVTDSSLSPHWTSRRCSQFWKIMAFIWVYLCFEHKFTSIQ